LHLAPHRLIPAALDHLAVTLSGSARKLPGCE
jgi:hypothetical protein